MLAQCENNSDQFVLRLPTMHCLVISHHWRSLKSKCYISLWSFHRCCQESKGQIVMCGIQSDRILPYNYALVKRIIIMQISVELAVLPFLVPLWNVPMIDAHAPRSFFVSLVLNSRLLLGALLHSPPQQSSVIFHYALHETRYIMSVEGNPFVSINISISILASTSTNEI